MTLQAITEMTTEGKPSMRKSSRHGAMGLNFANFTMAQARVDAKVIASGPAERKIAVRKASSSRLKKKLR